MVPDAPLPSDYGYDRIDDTTPITAVDLLPTFCDIAGVKLPKGYAPDGVSQLPALLGTSGSLRTEPVFWQWRTASRGGDNWPTLAVREGPWKMLLGKEASCVELFRFPGDRVEKTKLQEDHPDEVRRLRALIDAWKQTLPIESNNDCFSVQRGQ